MKRRYALLIEYDGTRFYGWQKQKEGRTIQGEIENALSEIVGFRVAVHGASRTDAGVHALCQVASFVAEKELPPDVIIRALNALLPSDIRIRDACEVPLEFNPQKDALFKTYIYALYEGFTPPPFIHRYVWPVKIRIDENLWQEVCSAWVGERDFGLFMNTGTPVKSTVRTVKRITLRRLENVILFIITANAFLKQMVRNMVGSLVEMQRGRLQPSQLKHMKPQDVERGFRYTAPPQGLFLVHIAFKYNLPFSEKTDKIYQKLKEWGHEV